PIAVDRHVEVEESQRFACDPLLGVDPALVTVEPTRVGYAHCGHDLNVPYDKVREHSAQRIDALLRVAGDFIRSVVTGIWTVGNRSKEIWLVKGDVLEHTSKVVDALGSLQPTVTSESLAAATTCADEQRAEFERQGDVSATQVGKHCSQRGIGKCHDLLVHLEDLDVCRCSVPRRTCIEQSEEIEHARVPGGV